MGLFSSEPPSHFPVVEGKRLDDAEVRFPHDLPADATLLIVAFQDDMDPLSDQWARLGDRIAEAHGDRFAVLEVPVVNSKLKLLGGLATMGIRGQVDTDAERSRTVPIYADVKAFRKALQVKTGDVTPFLVARDGRIAWRGQGEIDMDEVTELEAAVEDVLSQPVPPVTEHPDVEPEDGEAAEPEGAEPQHGEVTETASAEPTGTGPSETDVPADGPLAEDGGETGMSPDASAPDRVAARTSPPAAEPMPDPPPVRTDGRTLPPRDRR